MAEKSEQSKSKKAALVEALTMLIENDLLDIDCVRVSLKNKPARKHLRSDNQDQDDRASEAT